jgi:Lipid A 3-O-deacylase (PagL)
MLFKLKKKNNNGVLFFFLIFAFLYPFSGESQLKGAYPPHTKWYQDPFGLKPIELSSAFGFIWGSAAVTACLIFTKKDTALQKRFSFYQEAGYGFGYKPPYTGVLQNEIGIIYSIRSRMAVGIGGNTFHFKDKVNNTWTFGIRPFARWYAYMSTKAGLFLEYGAGISYSLNRFPLTGTGWESDTARTGTKFNLLSKYGAGVEINFSNRCSLQGGVRHFHLSNGNLAGIQRNPSHDSNGFFLGFVYTPKISDEHRR